MTTNKNGSILSGGKLVLARLAWWLVFLIYGMYSIKYMIMSWQSMGPEKLIFVNPFFGLGANLVSLLFGIFLYWKNSKNLMTILLSMMFISGSGFQGLFYYTGPLEMNLINITNFILLTTFLLFPHGRWIFRQAWMLLLAAIVVLSWPSLDPLLSGLALYFFLTAGCVLQIINYYRTQNPIERQQIKWIVITFFICTVVNFAAWLVASMAINNIPDAIASQGIVWLEFTNILYYFLITLAFTISLFRYRLWDIDILINKTLVYSALTGLLGLIAIVSLAVVDFLIQQLVGDKSSLWGVVISVIPVAAAFKPLRDRLQSLIDRYFKPEDVNFTDTFIEFTPAVLEMLTSERIIKTVSDQVQKQLNVDFARIYLCKADSQLHPATGNSSDQENSRLVLDEEQLARLQSGKIIVDDDGVPYSLLIPLIVPRASIPDLLGVIMLGKRLKGAGYSTPILKNLHALGADAGKAIYLSEIRAEFKPKVAA